MVDHQSGVPDAYTRYEAGLRLLLDLLGGHHPFYRDALTFQQRLIENIHQTRLVGDTEVRRADRSEIVRGLNELALATLGRSFNDLCDQALPPARRPARPAAPAHALLTINRGDAIDLFHQLMQSDAGFRVLRLTGDSKMGKSHLMSKLFPSLARQTYRARYAVLDLRNRAQSVPDILYAASGLLGGPAQFPTYYAAHGEWLVRPGVAVSDLDEALARALTQAQEEGAEGRGDEGAASRMWARRLALQFVTDLASSPDSQVVLLFDALEQADQTTQVWLMHELLVQLASLPHLRVVVAGHQTIPEPSGSYAALCRSCLLLPVKDAQEYISYCEQMGALLSKEQILALAKAFDYVPGSFVDVIPKFLPREAAHV